MLEGVWQSVGAVSAGSFIQTGGVNYDSGPSIQSNGSYQLSGGTLSVTGGLANQGLFSGGAARQRSSQVESWTFPAVPSGILGTFL